MGVGKTKDEAEWSVDMDVMGETVALSITKGQAAMEARMTPDQAEQLGRALVKSAQYVRQRSAALKN